MAIFDTDYIDIEPALIPAQIQPFLLKLVLKDCSEIKTVDGFEFSMPANHQEIPSHSRRYSRGQQGIPITDSFCYLYTFMKTCLNK